MPYFFSDNMVLQRQKPIQLWGTAAPKSSFTIDFNGEKKKVKAEANGNWKVTFPAREAGGPYEIHVVSDSSFSFKNVMIGDVWLCSGQSNMEWPVSKVFNASYELRSADLPQIRSFTVAKDINTNPQSNTTKATWQTCTPENAATFSAAAYFFAKEIHKTQNIPIGIIHTSWGGTLIEPWIGLQSMGEHPDFKELTNPFIAKYKGNNSLEESQQAYAVNSKNWMEQFQKTDSGFIEKWHSSAYKPINWKKLVAPDYWENHGLPDFDGIVWLRKEVNIPASMAGKSLLLNLETLKDLDIIYFNGTEVGRGTWQPGRRSYIVPKELVKEGKNLISIRLENLSGFGGFTSRDASQLWLKELVESDNPLIIPLSGEWLFKSSLRIGSYPAKPADPAENRRNPSVIYNAMIAPFANLGLKGFLWYQGEANASQAVQYKKLLPLLISDWRKQFNQGELPFIIAQLSGFGALTSAPVESNWAELREAQMATLSVPKTGLAVTIDVGNPYDVHPIYKQQVGERMAAEARRICYGESNLQTSPLYESMKIEGNKIRLKFKYAANGLKSKEGDLKGFAIAGEDKKFVWAKAKIEGSEVIVWQDGIENPKTVRYAWASSPVESNGANLYNQAGFPASPFRTDNP
ncbi:sialate O-acetylesterase [Dyadobacter sp. CY323]|uniref:sialate O-acetylesterase n=1 Tax=Dyadobacter sp. CY323 TaxID=2907302 RepID=UPI001F15A6C4|nr:sialate O-acetylesterase [Dyadobacter sp. CY323]MCE6989316.1 sialate O-acetylesterase [Dyadobacter sp. CY323]